MAINDIIAGILEAAEKEASEKVAIAKEEAQKNTEKSEKNISDTLADIQSKGDEKSAQIHKKVENLLSHEQKLKVLTMKHEVLESVFSEAKKQINALPAEKKEEIYLEIISEMTFNSGTVYPAKGEKSILEKALKNSQKPFDLGEEEEETGGFRFASDLIELDFRFTSLVDTELKKALEQELSGLLFDK